MQHFQFEKTQLEGLMLIHPFVAEDERGYFLKDYSQAVFEENGISHDLREVFYTSSHQGVVRAIHFQREKPQAKLIRVVHGSIFDIAVDLRKGSKTFGQWQGFYLSEENKQQLLIPGDFGHGYLVLEDSIVSYKCAEKFYGEFDDGIRWDDPELAITWPLEKVKRLIIADKDLHTQTFAEFKLIYGGL